MKNSPSLSARSLQREEVLASRQVRAQQLEKLIAEIHETLSSHKKGSRVLSLEELSKEEKRLHVYEKKLQQLQTIPDERDIDRILAREHMMLERTERQRARREEL